MEYIKKHKNVILLHRGNKRISINMNLTHNLCVTSKNEHNKARLKYVHTLNVLYIRIYFRNVT